MKQDCVFCKIISGQIPAKILYENSDLLAFNDINPQAPVHILIVPKKHIPDIDAIEKTDKELFGEVLAVAKELAKKNNLKSGYRVVVNCGSDAGQSVEHLHFHLLGGRKFAWPPG